MNKSLVSFLALAVLVSWTSCAQAAEKESLPRNQIELAQNAQENQENQPEQKKHEAQENQENPENKE